MHRRPLSISLRLTLLFGAILLSGWFLFGAAMWFTLQHTLTAERERTLHRRLDRLQDLLHRDAAAGANTTLADFRDFASATGGGLVGIVAPSGARLWPSPSMASSTFPWPAITATSHESFSQVQAAGQPFRVVQRSFQLGAQPVVLVAAAPEAGNVVLLNQFWSGLVVSAPVLVLIAMTGGYWMSRRALQPVDLITASVRSVGIRNLAERLPVTHSSDELQRLTETCNDMLERLEVAVRKLKQFTADASHELRGPLALTRTVAEVALRNPLIDGTSRTAFREVVEESARATAMLEHMLELARADSEPTDMKFEPVDLAQVVTEACSMARTLALQHGLAIHLDCCSGADLTVFGHASSLRRLLWILLDNAIKYTPAPGKVDVSVYRVEGATVVKVADTGIGIDEADLPHIFDRFFRADPSRSEVEGSGLGLCIAKWIADVHRAQIRVESCKGQGASFALHLPG